MTRNQIIKALSKSGFDMEAVAECNHSEIFIGYMTDGVVALKDYDRTAQAVDSAAKILGWGGSSCAWGGFRLYKGFQADPMEGTIYGREHY
jgi:hypothetical protein